MDTIQEVADRLERAADRYHNAADFQAEHDARNAADQARRAQSVLDAQQIEQAFINSHRGNGGGAPTSPQPYQDLSQNSGCLGGLFGGGSRPVMRPTGSAGPWRMTSAGGRPRFGFGGGPYYSTHHYFVSPGYAHYTLAQAAARHLPPGYSDPTAYAQQLANQTGVDPNSRLGDLSPEQLASVSSAIDTHPNWSQAQTLPDIAPGAASGDAREDSGDRGGGDFSTGQDFASAASPATSSPSDNS
jgi:hypothetical protein